MAAAAEQLLKLHEDADKHEWVVTPDGFGEEADWMRYLRGGGMVIGTAVNVVSCVVLLQGIVKKIRHNRAVKNMSEEERLLASNPLYRLMVDNYRSTEQLHTDIRALFASGDKIAAEVKALAHKQGKVA